MSKFFGGHLDNLARVAAAAIEVRELRKDYGPVEADAGAPFQGEPGEGLRLLGIVLQNCGFYPRVTVREALEPLSNANVRPGAPAEIIELVGLPATAD